MQYKFYALIACLNMSKSKLSSCSFDQKMFGVFSHKKKQSQWQKLMTHESMISFLFRTATSPRGLFMSDLGSLCANPELIPIMGTIKPAVLCVIFLVYSKMWHFHIQSMSLFCMHLTCSHIKYKVYGCFLYLCSLATMSNMLFELYMWQLTCFGTRIE